MDAWLRDAQYRVRALLASEVTWPDFDREGRTVEISQPLGSLLRTELPELIDCVHVCRSGPAASRERPPTFDALVHALQTLKTAGRVDHEVLAQGGPVLDGLIKQARDGEESLRAALDPEDPRGAMIAAQCQSEDALSALAQSNYHSYLLFHCARDALEKMQSGLSEINAALSKSPSSKRFRS